jgi:hypothetical protein
LRNEIIGKCGKNSGICPSHLLLILASLSSKPAVETGFLVNEIEEEGAPAIKSGGGLCKDSAGNETKEEFLLISGSAIDCNSV